MAAIVTAVSLTFKNKGKLGQALFVGVTILSSVFILGVYGYVVMVKANAFLRNIAVIQVFLVSTCLILTITIDIFLFRKAQNIGGIRWGKMPVRAQYTLILLCVTNVLIMGLMGYVRSGLREDWHVYGILRDTSAWAFTPSMAYMSRVVAVIVLLFLGLVTFVFWLGGLGERKSRDE
jgi:hypothetical protein